MEFLRLGAGSLSPTASGAAGSARKPNFLVILADDMAIPTRAVTGERSKIGKRI